MHINNKFQQAEQLWAGSSLKNGFQQATVMVKKVQRMEHWTCNHGIKYSRLRLRDKFYVSVQFGAIDISD